MPKPKGPPYLAFELDALPKSDLAAMSVGLDEGVSARALLRIWEYAWREQVEWVRSEVVLGCCKGNERLAGALTAAAYGFLEPVPAGWTSEPCTPEPIPVAGYRVRGARRYLRIGSPQSKGGHAAKGNLIPGARYRRPAETAESEGATDEPELSAASRLPLGCLSAEVSADSRHQRAATIDDRESQNQHLAGAVAPAGEPPPAGPIQTATAPANVVQVPVQAVLEGVPGRSAKAKRAKTDEKTTSPHFRPLSDRLVAGYLGRVGRAYKFQGAKDAEALKRLCEVIDSGALTVEVVGTMFERALVVDFNPVTGIANFEARFNDPRWAGDSAAQRDVRRGVVRAEDEHHEQGGSVHGF